LLPDIYDLLDTVRKKAKLEEPGLTARIEGKRTGGRQRLALLGYHWTWRRDGKVKLWLPFSLEISH